MVAALRPALRLAFALAAATGCAFEVRTIRVGEADAGAPESSVPDGPAVDAF
ncbi:MAG: hypothetical protein U0324_23655 [Polyangiales bacterium]